MVLWRNFEKLSIFIIFIPSPDFPHFCYMLGGNLGSLLYGDVSVMNSFKFIFILFFLKRIVIEKACHKSKFPIKMYRVIFFFISWFTDPPTQIFAF